MHSKMTLESQGNEYNIFRVRRDGIKRKIVPRDWGWGIGEMSFNGTNLQLAEKYVLEI